ncbi:MAG: ABC transporter ATP-binding protein [Brotaphodocola sp.]
MENKNRVLVKNLCYGYEKKTEIIHGITASFSPGKMTAMLGGNGCGKSTLLNLIAGILKPDSGEITLNGNNIRLMNRNTLAKMISVVHQNNNAPGDMTVEKLVMAGRTPYREKFRPFSKKDEVAVREALADTDTANLASRPVSALSGGQMQRVWLAMALAQETDILLLDEITTYLDIHYQMELLHLIAELNRKKGLTVIMVLHDINLALEFCQEVLVMKQGSVLVQGKTEEAVTEQILEEAFGISSNIITVEGSRHCIFRRKAEI